MTNSGSSRFGSAVTPVSPSAARGNTPTDADVVDMCLATFRFYPAYAGPAVRFQRYNPGLRARGIRMRAFSAAWSSPEQETPAEATGPGARLPRLEVDGIPIDRVWVGSGRHGRQLTFTRSLVQDALRTRPSVIQFLHLWQWSVPWLLRLKAAGIPMVYTATMLRQEGLHPLKVLHSSLPLRLMDSIVVSSGVMRDSFRAEGIKGRIEIIPNGLDLDRFRPATEEEKRRLRAELDLPEDGEVIVFIGGFISERKGVDVLAEAWVKISQRPNTHLVLVGPLVNDQKPSEEQRAFLKRVQGVLDSAPGRDRVVTAGAVSNVQDYLRAADVFVFPSRREGMPNTVLEALGCGVPSVLTPFIGLPEEFGRPGTEYLLSERTPDGLATAVTSILENPRLRDELSAAGRRWVEDSLGVETSLDRYAALYRELAGKAAAR